MNTTFAAKLENSNLFKLIRDLTNIFAEKNVHNERKDFMETSTARVRDTFTNVNSIPKDLCN